VPAGLSNVVQVAAGPYHCLALKTDGTVVRWGDAFIPAGLMGVTAIAAGGGNASHNLALLQDGTVTSWEWNGNEVLPVGISNYIAVAGGGNTSLAISYELRRIHISSTGRNAVIRFSTFPAYQYAVKFSNDLTTDRWLPLPGGMVQGDGNDALVSTPVFGAGPAAQFYRVCRLR
jgi:Regulator of chromosome condensation (RCC1) repeat